MHQQPITMRDSQAAPAWRNAAETSRRQYPSEHARASYYDAMADWHEGKRADMPKPARATLARAAA